MLSPAADTPNTQPVSSVSDPPHTPPPDTAAPGEGFPLYSPSAPNTFSKTDHQYVSDELQLRPWMKVHSADWQPDRFQLTARVSVLDPFLAFCRLIALGLNPGRLMQVQYLPCSDDEHWFSVQVGWRDSDGKAIAEQALANALWQIPV